MSPAPLPEQRNQSLFTPPTSNAYLQPNHPNPAPSDERHRRSEEGGVPGPDQKMITRRKLFPLTSKNKAILDASSSQGSNVASFLNRITAASEESSEDEEAQGSDCVDLIDPSESASQIASKDHNAMPTFSNLSAASAVTAGYTTAKYYAQILRLCNVIEGSIPEHNPFGLEALLEKKASLAANYENIRDRFDEFMAKYSMQLLSEDQICCMVRFAAAAALVDDYTNKEKHVGPYDAEHEFLDRPGTWNFGPLTTTTLAREPGSSYAYLSAPCPDLAITLPGRNQETSLLAAVANAYGNNGPDDAVNLLSDITWKELLTYEEIKAVLYLFKTDDKEPVNRYVFGIYMMLPFENKASPLEDDVASNQMLNCLFPMAVKLYEVKKQASVLFDKLQQSDTELLEDITQPTFNSSRPNIVVFGVCVCGNSWFVLGLELKITGVSGKYLGLWYKYAQGTWDDEYGRKLFMASVKTAYHLMVKLIIPTLVDAHRIFRAYTNKADVQKGSPDLKERVHKEEPCKTKKSKQVRGGDDESQAASGDVEILTRGPKRKKATIDG